MVEADKDRVQQIIVNLLSNAIAYTPFGGRVSVELESGENEVHIKIKDTGIGIPPKNLNRIFERFYRVEKSRSRDYGGTGLGLAIVKKLVKLLVGHIRVYSQVDHGTRFEIDFPMVDGGIDE